MKDKFKEFLSTEKDKKDLLTLDLSNDLGKELNNVGKLRNDNFMDKCIKSDDVNTLFNVDLSAVIGITRPTFRSFDQFLLLSSLTKWLPINPSAPVTITFFFDNFIYWIFPFLFQKNCLYSFIFEYG